MSPQKQARAIFCAIRGNSVKIKAKRDEFAALVDSITGAEAGMQITSSLVNGQSFGAKFTGNVETRFDVLTRLMAMLDADSAGGTKTVGRFH